MKSSTQIKEKPPQTIIPCPRCINGQILAINQFVCFQCGYEIPIVITLEDAKGDSDEKLFAELRRKHNYPCVVTERIICPQCGKEVYLALNNVIKPHKDPKTEGAFPRPWCEGSGVVIP